MAKNGASDHSRDETSMYLSPTKLMKLRLSGNGIGQRRIGSMLVLMWISLTLLSPGLVAANQFSFTFEDEEIGAVLKRTSELTGISYIFDPQKVHGKITILASGKVSPERALKLLESALAMRGYVVQQQGEIAWVTVAPRVGETLKVVPLDYANAIDVALTLHPIVPQSVRIAPYTPTNSLILWGNKKAVEDLIRLIKGARGSR